MSQITRQANITKFNYERNKITINSGLISRGGLVSNKFWFSIQKWIIYQKIQKKTEESGRNLFENPIEHKIFYKVDDKTKSAEYIDTTLNNCILITKRRKPIITK